MSDPDHTRLNAESHLLLDQPTLRLPHELVKRNLKSVQRHIERERDEVLSTIPKLAKSAANAESSDQAAAVEGLNNAITRMQGLKRKLEALCNEEKTLHKQSRARIDHLNDLYGIPSLADVKYDAWSQLRLDRLMTDYLLRMGYLESAQRLAKEKGIEALVDTKAFVQCHQIEASLKNGRTQEALAWCNENRQALKKMNSSTDSEDKLANDLEYQLRLQQYIELVRDGDQDKILGAASHFRKYLSAYHVPSEGDSGGSELSFQAAGLLAFDEDTMTEPFKSLYSPHRWPHLAKLFVQTHHALFQIPHRPPMHIALSAGLSALKTPACHSRYTSSSSNASSASTTVCPICSTELNELAKGVPYAHHSKSNVENDPVVLPNGRVYGRERLVQINETLGTEKDYFRDPLDMSTKIHASSIKKVFIT